MLAMNAFQINEIQQKIIADSKIQKATVETIEQMQFRINNRITNMEGMLSKIID